MNINPQINISNYRDFDDHEAIVYLNDAESGLEGFIAIHRFGRNGSPAFGATRYWTFVSDSAALEDALRLSKLMTYKSALAGFDYGGGKGVIIARDGEKQKAEILSAYAKKLNTLSGKFITGTDVGLSLQDLESMARYTDFLVGFSCNPEMNTALGLMASMKAVNKRIFGSESLDDRTVAIQGLGKVGIEFINLLSPKTKIIAADINPDAVNTAKKIRPDIEFVSSNEIHKAKCDIFMPCALSHALNEDSVVDIKAKIILGSANNQLKSPAVGDIMHRLGILYCPDYVVNAGGLISVIYEYENSSYTQDDIRARVEKIGETLTSILDESEKTNRPPYEIANNRAKEIIGK